MTRIQKILRDIENLQDFYKRTNSLRVRIKKKELERDEAKQEVAPDQDSTTLYPER